MAKLGVCSYCQTAQPAARIPADIVDMLDILNDDCAEGACDPERDPRQYILLHHRVPGPDIGVECLGVGTMPEAVFDE